MTKRITVGKVIKQLEKKTGRKIKLVPHYSEKRRKWTVKAVYDD